MLYFSLGTEWRRIVCSPKLHLKMDTLTTVELGRIMEEAFIRPRVIIFDRYASYHETVKGRVHRPFLWQNKGVIGKLRTWKPRRLFNQRPLYCQHARFQNSERTIDRIYQPCSRNTFGKNMELGQRNQLKITNSQPTLQLNTTITHRQFLNSNQRPNFQA